MVTEQSMPTPSDMLEPKIIVVCLTKDQKQTFYKGLTEQINITNNREDNIFLMLLCIMQLGKTVIYKNYFPLNLEFRNFKHSYIKTQK